MRSLLLDLARLQRWALPLILAITAALYLPHLGGGFFFLDDHLLVLDNPSVQRLSAAAVRRAFTTFDPELYVPLTIICYSVEHALFGFQPLYFHLTNLLLHLCCIALVYAVLRRLFGRSVCAWGTALLFAVHPLNVETVLWIAARKDLLAACFGLASFFYYLRWREDGGNASWMASVFLLFAGLLSKVSVVTLPLVFLLEEWRRGRKMLPGILSLWPHWILSVLFGCIAMAGKTGVSVLLPLSGTLLLVGKSLAFQAWHVLWPSGYSLLYPQTLPVHALSFDMLLSWGTLLCVAIALLFLHRHRLKDELFAIGFFFLLILPSISTFEKNGFVFFASDRYAYLAMIGIVLSALLGLARVLRYVHLRSVDAVLGAVAVLWALILFPIAMMQASLWSSSMTVFQHALQLYPANAFAEKAVGDLELQSGDTQAAWQSYQQAVAHDPCAIAAWGAIGELQMNAGKASDAKVSYQRAIQCMETEHLAFPQMLGAYYKLGAMESSEGHDAESLALFQRAVAMAPTVPDAYYNLGLQYQLHGRNDEAMVAFRQTIKLWPAYTAAHYHLAGILAAQGKLEEAASELQTVLSLDPLFAEAAVHLKAIQNLMGLAP